MRVAERGGVKRTSNELPGAMSGVSRRPAPLKPGSPSKKLFNSIPYQCTAAGSGRRFTTVIRTGRASYRGVAHAEARVGWRVAVERRPGGAATRVVPGFGHTSMPITGP